MTQNKQLPLPVVLWLCGWEGCEAQYEDSKDGFFARLGYTYIHIDNLDGISCYDDRDRFWATVRSMEQMSWAKKIYLQVLQIEDLQIKYALRYRNEECFYDESEAKFGQTPWDCLVAMVSEIYWSGVCK